MANAFSLKIAMRLAMKLSVDEIEESGFTIRAGRVMPRFELLGNLAPWRFLVGHSCAVGVIRTKVIAFSGKVKCWD